MPIRPLPVLLVTIVTGSMACCTATPPKSRAVSYDPVLRQEKGTLIMVDACVQRVSVGHASDYFVINEAQAGAEAAANALRKYIHDSDIPVRAEIISVCGARLNADNAPIKIADMVGALAREAEQPVKVHPDISDDPTYLHAISTVSTYALERAAVQSKFSQSNHEDLAGRDKARRVSTDDFRTAAAVVEQRTGASSVLFLGVLGNSFSGGLKAAEMLTNLAISGAVAFATAGLGTGYYVLFAPGHEVEGMVMEGALIDLATGRIAWSNAIRVRGDPINPEAMAKPEALDLLFHGILFEPSLGQNGSELLDAYAAGEPVRNRN